MKDFGYCIWYLPKTTGSKDDWNCKTDNFPCHITLKKNLSFIQAIKQYHNIIPQDLEFELDTQVVSQQEGFHSLYYTLKLINNSDPIPYWIPEDLHISFKYSYTEFLKCDKELIMPSMHFDKIALVNCNGHYKNWTIIDQK